MKKAFACLSALAVLASVILTLPLVAGAEDSMSVRILNDFETTTLTETNSSIVTTGAQTNSFEAGGRLDSTALKMKNNSDGWLEYDVYNYDAAGVNNTWRDEWQEAKYLQFWVKNDGPGSVYVCFSSMKKDEGTMDHWQEYRFTDAAQFVGSTDAGKTWTNLDKQMNANNVYEVVIPSGFNGYVRVELSTETLSLPNPAWGAYDGKIGKLEMTFGVKKATVFVDDVALVGNFSDVVSDYQTEEETYFADGVVLPEETVRILNDFSAATLKKTNSSIVSTGAQANSFEAGGYNGSTGLKMSNDNDGWLEYNVYSYTASAVADNWRADWREAKYLQFWVKNEGPGKVYVCFSSMKKDQGALDYHQDYRFTESTQFKCSTDGATWSNLDKQLNGNNFYEVGIPAGFEGFVRAELNAINVAYPDQGWGTYTGQIGKLEMTFGVKNATVFVDDVALVSEAFSSTVEGYQYSLADYLSGNVGGEDVSGGEGGSSGGSDTPAGDVIELEPVEDIRVLQDFTDSSRTETNAGNVTTGGQANSFEAGGVDGTVALKMYNDGDGWLEYNIYSYDAAGVGNTWRDEWQQAKYFQFYIKNEGPGVTNVAITSMKKDSGAMDHWQEYDITESAQFVCSIDGETWYTMDKQVNGNGIFEVTIPANFAGYVRVELNAANLAFPDAGWGTYDGQVGKLEMTFGVKNATVYVDDIALAGDFTDSISGAQTPADVYFGLRQVVEMPEDIENIRTVMDFEKGVADINSGINYIPAIISQSDEWSSTGSYSLKLLGLGEGGGTPALTQIQPSSFYGDAATAEYIEFSVKNPSDVPFGITWMSVNGSGVSAYSAEISIFEDGYWYLVDAYDADSFAIPANYEGKIRIKLGEGGVILMDTLITKMEFAVKESSRTAGATLYMDTFCLLGEPLPEIVYEEVDMPTDLDYIKTVLDFESINLTALKSGINYLPATFSVGSDVADSGNALVLTTGTGGGIPNLSQVQPPKIYQNWTGGRYMEMWVSNPNEFDFAICWGRIDGEPYDMTDTEIAFQREDGKWYKPQVGGDANGYIIPAGYTGRVRIKLDSKFGDLIMVDSLEFAVWCAVDVPGQKFYVDSIAILGDMEMHDEPEIMQTVSAFPVDVILQKIAEGQTNIHYQVSENIAVPAELLEAIKGKDIVFSYTVMDHNGVGLYRWTLVGNELEDVTAFYPQVTMDAAALSGDTMVKPFSVEDGEVAGAYLSMYVRKDFPSFTKLFVYGMDADAESGTLLGYGDYVNEQGWFTVSLLTDGNYLLPDMLIESYDNTLYPSEDEPSDPDAPSDTDSDKPSDSDTKPSPDTGDARLPLIVAALFIAFAAEVIAVLKKKGENI